MCASKPLVLSLLRNFLATVDYGVLVRPLEAYSEISSLLASWLRAMCRFWLMISLVSGGGEGAGVCSEGGETGAASVENSSVIAAFSQRSG